MTAHIETEAAIRVMETYGASTTSPARGGPGDQAGRRQQPQGDPVSDDRPTDNALLHLAGGYDAPAGMVRAMARELQGYRAAELGVGVARTDAMSDELSDAEWTARCFHGHYEANAPEFSYKTREASAVAWDDVPEQNRRLMVCTAGHALRDLMDRGWTPPAPTAMSRSAAEVLACHFAAHDDTYVHPEQQVAGDAAIAALAAYGLTVVPNGQVQLDGERWTVEQQAATFAVHPDGLAARWVRPVDGPK